VQDPGARRLQMANTNPLAKTAIAMPAKIHIIALPNCPTVSFLPPDVTYWIAMISI